ncbi:pentapeptide repeat-containing protein [Streptomyces sp. NPDC048558]|uniref:pentapeptide repeat-containing protein n=1 Tax=Streptomyces sp. NPDC048558 TaxID=3155759 RepID=UPI00343CE2B2
MPERRPRHLRPRRTSGRTSQNRAISRARVGQAPTANRLDWARRIELLAVLVASFVAVAGLWYSNLQNRQANVQNRQTNDNARQDRALAKEGQITDRYTAAVTNLGEDKLDVRLGGIYALQRIMYDSPRDHPTITNVMAAYIRTHTSTPPGKGQPISADVSAALSVLTRRDASRDGALQLDLRGSWLPGVDLSLNDLDPNVDSGERIPLAKADLRDSHLPKADLDRADLYKANLHGADLAGANLRFGDLHGANMENAELNDVNMYAANLHEARMQHADLAGASFSGADLHEADLYEADLGGADLGGADLRDANLTRANLRNATLGGGNLRDANLQEANLRGAGLGNVDLRRADLRGADMRETYAEAKSVVRAFIDSDTKMQPWLARDPAIRARIAEVEAEGFNFT